MPDYTTPDFGKAALVIIDVQNDFALPGAPAEIPGTMQAVPNMQRLANVFRHYNLPVIHVVRLYFSDGSNTELCRKNAFEKGRAVVVPETHGAEIVDALKPSMDIQLDTDLLMAGESQSIGENEWIVYKPRWGAFFRTPLEAHLRSLDVNTLIFAGCNFPNCPRTSIYEAGERDFRLVLVRDAISGLYDIGEKEMQNIGVHLMKSKAVIEAMEQQFH